MQVVLKVVGGKNDAREISISVPRFIIGRGDTAHLRPSSDLVSREHCEILVETDGNVIVNDLRSRNGTFVNGKKLEETHRAKSGDSLRVGRLQFEIVIDPVKASSKKPKVQGVVEAASRTATKGKNNQSLEDSITDWLMDEAEEPDSEERRKIALNETIQLNLEETSVFGRRRDKMGDSDDGEADEPLEEESSENAKKKKPGKMKIPTNMKNKHESSTTAADDVLRKFFNRR